MHYNLERLFLVLVHYFFYQLPTSGLSDHIQKNIEIDFQIYAFLEFFEMSGTMYINY